MVNISPYFQFSLLHDFIPIPSHLHINLWIIFVNLLSMHLKCTEMHIFKTFFLFHNHCLNIHDEKCNGKYAKLVRNLILICPLIVSKCAKIKFFYPQVDARELCSWQDSNHLGVLPPKTAFILTCYGGWPELTIYSGIIIEALWKREL